MAVALAMAATATIATVDPCAAQAPVGLKRAGPVDPANGFPLYYEDAAGLRLGLCTDPNLCFFAAPNPAAPVSFPDNWPDEAFYFAMNSAMDGINGARALLVTALEAAFVNGAVVPGEQMVFTRIRVRLQGLVPGASYTISNPWGSQVEVADDFGTIFATRDVGAGGALQFDLAVNGNVGPFVTPTSFVPGSPAGTFLSDGATDVAIVGSPLGQNYFRVQGPQIANLFPAFAIGPDSAQVTVFQMQGQVATRLGAAVDKVTYTRSATQTAVNIWATTASGQLLQAAADASIPVAMVESGTSGVYFARVELGAGAQRPAGVSVANLSDFPPSSFSSTAVRDEVIVNSAIFTVGGDLVVQATSADEVANPALTAIADGIAPALLASNGLGVAAGPMSLSAGAPPPRTVTVTSAAGGRATVDVAIRGNGTPVGIPPALIADAGLDQTVDTGATVTLNGLTSSGNIVAFQWTHDAGAAIALLGANTATPSFVAPVVAAGAVLRITFTLTITSALGALSSDVMSVTVNGPIAVPDVVTVQDARFDARRNFWRASGVVRLTQLQTVTLYVGFVGDRSRRIATVATTALGAWTYTGANGSAATNGTIPAPGETTMWAESSLGGAPGSRAFRVQ